MAGSVSLVGFGLERAIEVTSGAAWLWRLQHDFDPSRREQVEPTTLRRISHACRRANFLDPRRRITSTGSINHLLGSTAAREAPAIAAERCESCRAVGAPNTASRWA